MVGEDVIGGFGICKDIEYLLLRYLLDWCLLFSTSTPQYTKDRAMNCGRKLHYGWLKCLSDNRGTTTIRLC